ncbi:hypothetical protein CN645_07925 [Burkholderia sp. IDO3]|nr:hypothetical protein DCN14_11100 [Burkholderia sp. IDO3]PCD62179.1 hypothetical protein CN645_07925 [Burkholderia sp. IDO3]
MRHTAGNAVRAHRHAASRPACRAGRPACPQIVLASVWIACAYSTQALDPKDFVRAASNRARSFVQRLPRVLAGLSTIFVGKDVDILSTLNLSR